jgi:hypothetical protein
MSVSASVFTRLTISPFIPKLGCLFVSTRHTERERERERKKTTEINIRREDTYRRTETGRRETKRGS